MALTRKNKKNSRKSNRKSSRKNTRKNRQYGGSMMAQSLAQGRQFAEYHTNQHGGAQVYSPAPVGDQGLLEDGLRASARISVLDASIADARAQGPDQAGGKRRSNAARKGSKKSKKAKKSKSKKSKKSKSKSKTKKSRKSSKKSKKSKKSRKSSKKSKSRRNQTGGMAPVGQNPMLLSAYESSKAGTADFSKATTLH